MRRRLLGLALLSAALLLAEISLTRFYSVRYYPPVVYAILSLALLGIGLGAAVAAWSPTARQPRHAAAYAGAMALALAGLLLTLTLWTGPVAEGIGGALGLLLFVFFGLTMATLYGAWSAESPTLYWADLTGAGLGAIMAVPLLNWVGVIDALLLAALTAALAAILFRPSQSKGLDAAMPLAALAVTALLFISSLLANWLTVDMARLPTEKPIGERLADGGQIRETAWDGFARTDLVDPGQGAPYELYMDGAAGSVMPPAGGHPALWQDIGFFPYATEQPARVFIVGPGGGLDIWFGLQSGAQAITAAEVNRASTRIVAENAAYNGGLADRPEVRLVVDEGRSLLARESLTYDLISLSQVVTAAAERDGYALVENDTYTVEAFDTYLEHLTDDGLIALKLYDEITLARALTTAVAALNRRGQSDSEALLHIMALMDPRVDPPIPLLLVRNRPYTREDSLALGAVAHEVGFTPLYLPLAWAEPPLDAIADGETSLAQFIETSEQNLAPTTDDRPFFFQFEHGLPNNLSRLLLGVGALAIAVVATAGLSGGAGGQSAWPTATYFALAGFGFIVAEVAMIQQVRLFLGHPTDAVAVVLATLLLGGGMGSALLGRTRGAGITSALPTWPGVVIFALLVIWTLLWPRVSDYAALTPLGVRVAVAALSILPVAIFMGMPFPLGLRVAGRAGQRPVAWAWAVNGVLSVFGSVVAIAVAILAGFSLVFVAAALAYLGVGLAARWINTEKSR